MRYDLIDFVIDAVLMAAMLTAVLFCMCIFLAWDTAWPWEHPVLSRVIIAGSVYSSLIYASKQRKRDKPETSSDQNNT